MTDKISANGDATSQRFMNELPQVPLERRAKLFRGLGDHSRLLILDTLCANDLTVSEIVERTGLSQSNASNHLRCLGECGLVTSEREGRFARYRLADSQVAELLERADALLDAVAIGVESCLNYR